jgi:hypothetical protein
LKTEKCAGFDTPLRAINVSLVFGMLRHELLQK